LKKRLMSALEMATPEPKSHVGEREGSRRLEELETGLRHCFENTGEWHKRREQQKGLRRSGFFVLGKRLKSVE